MPTHTFGQTFSSGGNSITKSVNRESDGELNFDLTISASTVDRLVSIDFNPANVKSLYILSDQNLTLQTNNGSTPTDTINLIANEPLVWLASSYYTCPFGSAVTALYVTNGTTSPASLRIRTLIDVTP